MDILTGIQVIAEYTDDGIHRTTFDCDGFLRIGDSAKILSTKDFGEIMKCLRFYANGGNSNKDIWYEEKLGYFTGLKAKELMEKINSTHSTVNGEASENN